MILKIIYIFSFISFIICLGDNNNENYRYIYFLPLAYLVFNFLLYKKSEFFKKSFVYKIFQVQALVRYTIIPLGIANNDYIRNGYDSFNHDLAILYMIIELFFILIFFNFQSFKLNRIFITKKLKFISINIYLLVFIIVIFGIILTSGFFSKVYLIWDMQTTEEKLEDVEDVSSIGGLLFHPFKITLLLLFSSLIFTTKMINNNRKYLYQIVLMGLASIFIVGVSRLSILLFILPFYFILINFLEKKYIKKINLGLIILLIPIFIITSISKFSKEDNKIESNQLINTDSLNAYFNGPGNVSVGIDAFNNFHNQNYLLYFFNDIFQNVPLFSKLTISEYKSNYLYNYQIYSHNNYQDQIVPLSIAGLFHFNILGIGFYSCLFLSFAFYFEKKAKKEEYLPYKYVYYFLMVTTSMIFMLNIGSIIVNVFRTFVFIFLPFYFIKSSHLINKN